MDKRRLAEIFRARLGQLIAAEAGGLARFARETGLDRSALSQFLDPEQLRLPRAETLRRIAEAKGSSVDWLIGLANVAEGGQEVAPSLEIELAEDAEGGTPLARWQREAVGGKIRYVPSGLPDLLRLPDFTYEAVEAGRAEARAEHAAGLIDDARLRDTDVEICMALQALEALAHGIWVWSDIEAGIRRRQLEHMARATEALYPSIRLHLYDGRRSFSAPFTVFAMKRAAVYLGRSYLVVTSAEQVRSLARHFDELVREAVVAPHAVHETLAELARTTR